MLSKIDHRHQIRFMLEPHADHNLPRPRSLFLLGLVPNDTFGHALAPFFQDHSGVSLLHRL